MRESSSVPAVAAQHVTPSEMHADYQSGLPGSRVNALLTPTHPACNTCCAVPPTLLQPGRITLLLGTPGSGRSVLMKTLSGRLRNEKALKVRGCPENHGQLHLPAACCL